MSSKYPVIRNEGFWEDEPPETDEEGREFVVTPVRGRKRKIFRQEFIEQAEKLCLLLGATDEDLAAFFDVAPSSLRKWRNNVPEFDAAIRRGKMVADTQVAHTFYQLAVGGRIVKRVKPFADAKTGRQILVEYEEELAPNAHAAMAWLKFRQPEKWSNASKPEIEDLEKMTDEQLAEIAAGRLPGQSKSG